MEHRSRGMQSAIRVLRTLEVLADHQPIGVGDLAKVLELPKSTTQRYLITLEEAGWIRQHEGQGGAWSLSAHAVSIGRRVEPDFVAAAQEPLRSLRDQTGETVHLCVRDGANAVIIDRAESSHVLRIARPFGDKTALHATASGRAMLALYSDEEILRILPASLPALTPATVTDHDALLAEIEGIRRAGYAVNRSQNELGICAIGAAVRDRRGRPHGAIVISVPSFRFDDADLAHWGSLVVAAARHTSAAMHF